MYVCMYVCVCVCMYVCVCVYVCTYVCVCMYAILENYRTENLSVFAISVPGIPSKVIPHALRFSRVLLVSVWF
jgi:hypothetical protein